MDPLNVGPKEWVELVVATTLVAPATKWLFGELWARLTRKEAQLDDEDKSLRALVQRVADKMDNSFAEVRGLINTQNLNIRELQIESKHAMERLEKAEEVLEALRQRIEEAK